MYKIHMVKNYVYKIFNTNLITQIDFNYENTLIL